MESMVLALDPNSYTLERLLFQHSLDENESRPGTFAPFTLWVKPEAWMSIARPDETLAVSAFQVRVAFEDLEEIIIYDRKDGIEKPAPPPPFRLVSQDPATRRVTLTVGVKGLPISSDVYMRRIRVGFFLTAFPGRGVWTDPLFILAKEKKATEIRAGAGPTQHRRLGLVGAAITITGTRRVPDMDAGTEAVCNLLQACWKQYAATALVSHGRIPQQVSSIDLGLVPEPQRQMTIVEAPQRGTIVYRQSRVNGKLNGNPIPCILRLPDKYRGILHHAAQSSGNFAAFARSITVSLLRYDFQRLWLYQDDQRHTLNPLEGALYEQSVVLIRDVSIHLEDGTVTVSVARNKWPVSSLHHDRPFRLLFLIRIPDEFLPGGRLAEGGRAGGAAATAAATDPAAVDAGPLASASPARGASSGGSAAAAPASSASSSLASSDPFTPAAMLSVAASHAELSAAAASGRNPFMAGPTVPLPRMSGSSSSSSGGGGGGGGLFGNSMAGSHPLARAASASAGTGSAVAAAAAAAGLPMPFPYNSGVAAIPSEYLYAWTDTFITGAKQSPAKEDMLNNDGGRITAAIGTGHHTSMMAYSSESLADSSGYLSSSMFLKAAGSTKLAKSAAAAVMASDGAPVTPAKVARAALTMSPDTSDSLASAAQRARMGLRRATRAVTAAARDLAPREAAASGSGSDHMDPVGDSYDELYGGEGDESGEGGAGGVTMAVSPSHPHTHGHGGSSSAVAAAAASAAEHAAFNSLGSSSSSTTSYHYMEDIDRPGMKRPRGSASLTLSLSGSGISDLKRRVVDTTDTTAASSSSSAATAAASSSSSTNSANAQSAAPSTTAGYPGGLNGMSSMPYLQQGMGAGGMGPAGMAPGSVDRGAYMHPFGMHPYGMGGMAGMGGMPGMGGMGMGGMMQPSGPYGNPMSSMAMNPMMASAYGAGHMGFPNQMGVGAGLMSAPPMMPQQMMQPAAPPTAPAAAPPPAAAPAAAPAATPAATPTPTPSATDSSSTPAVSTAPSVVAAAVTTTGAGAGAGAGAASYLGMPPAMAMTPMQMQQQMQQQQMQFQQFQQMQQLHHMQQLQQFQAMMHMQSMGSGMGGMQYPGMYPGAPTAPMQLPLPAAMDSGTPSAVSGVAAPGTSSAPA